MKEYLTQFFKDFSYQKSDAEFLLTSYEVIVQNDEANKIWQNAITLYEKDINCDFKELLNYADKVADIVCIHKYTTELLLCICLTKRLMAEYEARNIDLEIYHNSVLDLRYKLDECKIIKGVVGSFVAYWFDCWFNLKRFALGRLQFELTTLGAEYQNFSVDSLALAVHIPRSGEPLTVEACDKSFNMAKSFFKNRFDNFYVFTCRSWLLYPENKQILPDGSNVKSFMKRFDIIESFVAENGGDLWRIFDTEEININLLPTDTSMRKAYVDYLKNGGKFGWGFGVILME